MSKSSDTALVASGSRRAKKERFGAKRKMMGKKQSSSSGDNSAGSATTPGNEDRKVSCSIFEETGHTLFKCDPSGSAASAVKQVTTLTNVLRWQRRTRTWRFRIKRARSRMQTANRASCRSAKDAR